MLYLEALSQMPPFVTPQPDVSNTNYQFVSTELICILNNYFTTKK